MMRRYDLGDRTWYPHFIKLQNYPRVTPSPTKWFAALKGLVDYTSIFFWSEHPYRLALIPIRTGSHFGTRLPLGGEVVQNAFSQERASQET